MNEPIAILIFIILDISFAVLVTLVAIRVGIGGLVGALIGLLGEVIRIAIAMALTPYLNEVDGRGILEFLINLRIYNIPILIGIGLISGATGRQQAEEKETLRKVKCFSCHTEFLIEPLELKSEPDEITDNIVECKKCKASILVQLFDHTIISTAEYKEKEYSESQKHDQVTGGL